MYTQIRKLILKNVFNIGVITVVVGFYFLGNAFDFPMLFQLVGMATLLIGFLKAKDN